MRFVLASTSPARLALLRGAGLEPEIMAPGVDEEATVAALEAEGGNRLSASELVQALAEAKAEAVAGVLRDSIDDATLVFGGDSAFEIDGQIHGKPHTAAKARWLAQNGRTGTLWSGHRLVLLRAGQPAVHLDRVASATVTFAELGEQEIERYIATGEPLEVAGAFTIDSLGGPFIARVEGDPSTVVGLSLATLRTMVRELGLEWTELWGTSRAPALT